MPRMSMISNVRRDSATSIDRRSDGSWFPSRSSQANWSAPGVTAASSKAERRRAAGLACDEAMRISFSLSWGAPPAFHSLILGYKGEVDHVSGPSRGRSSFGHAKADPVQLASAFPVRDPELEMGLLVPDGARLDDAIAGDHDGVGLPMPKGSSSLDRLHPFDVDLFDVNFTIVIEAGNQIPG